MEYTPNLQLAKPAGTDTVDISVLNGNMDIIDSASEQWGGGVSASQSDWDENDSSKVSYVKNRPFYDIVETGDAIFTFDSEYSSTYYVVDGTVDLPEEATTTQINAKLRANDQWVDSSALGATVVIQRQNDTTGVLAVVDGNPVAGIILNADYNPFNNEDPVYAKDKITVFSGVNDIISAMDFIGLHLTTKTPVKIPQKYIETDWNDGNSESVSHIKNRPIWSVDLDIDETVHPDGKPIDFNENYVYFSCIGNLDLSSSNFVEQYNNTVCLNIGYDMGNYGRYDKCSTNLIDGGSLPGGYRNSYLTANPLNTSYVGDAPIEISPNTAIEDGEMVHADNNCIVLVAKNLVWNYKFGSSDGSVVEFTSTADDITFFGLICQLNTEYLQDQFNFFSYKQESDGSVSAQPTRTTYKDIYKAYNTWKPVRAIIFDYNSNPSTWKWLTLNEAVSAGTGEGEKAFYLFDTLVQVSPTKAEHLVLKHFEDDTITLSRYAITTAEEA